MEVTAPAQNEGFPEIEHYTCYRNFLRDFYLYRKETRKQFSFRQFAMMSNIKSPNYLQLVMQSKRNLSLDKAQSVVKAMKLSAIESRYFLALVQKDNADGELENTKAMRELMIAAKNLCQKKMPQAQKELLRKWYSLVVREMVTLQAFEDSSEWISTKLREYITAKEAEQVLVDLEKAGFIKKEKGRWIQTDPVLTTGEAFDEERILHHHQETLKVWTQHLKEFRSEDRELGLLNIPICPSKIPELQQKIRDFQSELIGWLKDEDNPQKIVQVGVYLVPITR